SACCGIVGLKPSRGRITLAPAAAEGWGSLSTVGPMARTVRDVALMLDAMAGPALGDPYSAPPNPRPFLDAISVKPKRLKLATISESKLGVVEPKTLAALESAVSAMRQLGHTVEPLPLDPADMLNRHV